MLNSFFCENPRRLCHTQKQKHNHAPGVVLPRLTGSPLPGGPTPEMLGRASARLRFSCSLSRKYLASHGPRKGVDVESALAVLESAASEASSVAGSVATPEARAQRRGNRAPKPLCIGLLVGRPLALHHALLSNDQARGGRWSRPTASPEAAPRSCRTRGAKRLSAVLVRPSALLFHHHGRWQRWQRRRGRREAVRLPAVRGAAHQVLAAGPAAVGLRRLPRNILELE